MSVAARFIHISFTKAPEIEAAKEVFNSALDWMYYTPQCWILYSNTEIDTWRDRIKNKLVPGGDAFFMIEFQRAQDSGFMPKFVWEWLSKSR